MIEHISRKLPYTRMISVNADGSDMKALTSAGSSRALGVAQSGGDIIDWGPDGSIGSSSCAKR
jgi:hypothetical protein